MALVAMLRCKHSAEDMRMWPVEESYPPAGRQGLSDEELREGGNLPSAAAAARRPYSLGLGGGGSSCLPSF